MKFEVNTSWLLVISVLLLLTPATAATFTGGGFSVFSDKSGQATGLFTASGDVASSQAQANGLVTIGETRWVEDILGNHAEVGLNVDNGDGVDYSYKISPREGKLFLTRPQLTAEMALSVGSADSIEARAESWSKKGTANEKRALSEIEIGSDIAGGASLTGYSNLAYATLAGSVGASQTLQRSSGDTITVLTEATDGSQLSRIGIGISAKDVYGPEFAGSTMATAGSSTKTVLDGRILGELEVDAEAVKGTQSLDTSRKPVYGVEYLLLSEASTGSAGPALSNKLGYCIDEEGRSETIQGAIDDTPDDQSWHDTIYLGPGEYTGAIISRSVDVVGSGSDKTTVTGASSVFTVNPGVTTTLADMEITGGSADYGGGIYNKEGTLTVENCDIHHNFAKEGGGISNYAIDGTASTTVKDSNIYNNIADYDGGGIYNFAYKHTASASTTVTDSDIHDNYAGNDGGGIYNEANSDTASASTTVTNSNIYSNTARVYGGGIYNEASYGTASASTTVTGSNIYSNSARYGGGISNEASYGTASASTTVTDSDIYDNYAENDGGGIYNFAYKHTASASTTVTNSDIYDNYAGYDGGGIYNEAKSDTASASTTVTGSNICNNAARVYGGGIYNRAFDGTASASTTVTGSNIYSNTANEYGGGIYNQAIFGWGPASTTVTGSNIYSNTANEYGGGIWNNDALVVDRSYVMFNTAGEDGGGIYNEGDLTNIWSWVLFNRPNNVVNV